MSNQCGNPNHPKGAWHIATALPGSWQYKDIIILILACALSFVIGAGVGGAIVSKGEDD